jgi:hypothetical protein
MFLVAMLLAVAQSTCGGAPPVEAVRPAPVAKEASTSGAGVGSDCRSYRNPAAACAHAECSQLLFQCTELTTGSIVKTTLPCRANEDCGTGEECVTVRVEDCGNPCASKPVNDKVQICWPEAE